MVRVSAGFAYHIDGFGHGKILFHQKNTDKLGDNHGRMGIVNLDYRMFIQLVKVVAVFLHFLNDKAGAVGHHEILLVNTQQVACFVGIIRV